MTARMFFSRVLTVNLDPIDVSIVPSNVSYLAAVTMNFISYCAAEILCFVKICSL